MGRDAAIIRRWTRINEIHTCKCGGHRINCGGAPTCTSCGLQGPFTVPMPEMDLTSWRKKKSVHKRSKWFSRRISGVVNNSYEEMLTADFMDVVTRFMKGRLNKNVSRYNYYIIRLASRRGVPLLKPVGDMMEGKTKNVFNDRLFGVVYRELGWDTDCTCPLYLEWQRFKEII